MTCSETKPILSAHLEGEATASQWRLAEEHMRSCSECAQIWQNFQAAAVLLKTKLPHLEPSAALWDHIAARLEHAPAKKFRLGERWRQRVEALFAPAPRAVGLMKFGFALLVLILAGLPFVLQHSSPERVATHAPAGRDTTLAAATLSRPSGPTPLRTTGLERQMADYLEATRIILLEVKNNTGGEQELDVQGLRQTSQRLLEQSVTLKADLKQARAAALQNLVEQLELLLLEFANLAEQPQREEVELLRADIRQNDLLIKIEIVDLKALAKSRSMLPPKPRPENKSTI